jgi:hypothetical protein
LRRRDAGEVLSLLRRKVDANPLLPIAEKVVASIFERIAERTRLALRQA